MTKKYIVLLLAFVACFNSINAQVRPGLKMGYNIGGIIADDNATPYRLKTESGNPDNFKLRSGFQAGIIADCPINDEWAIQPGVRFAMQGFKDEWSSGTSQHSQQHQNIRTFNLFYLQVPVYAQYRMNVAEDVNLLFQAGPYAGYALFGRHNHVRGGRTQELSNNKINFGNEPALRPANSADMKNIDYGLSAGFGVEFFRFQLLLAYDVGLSETPFMKIPGDTYNILMRNQCFSVTLAVIFGRRDPLQRMRDF